MRSGEPSDVGSARVWGPAEGFGPNSPGGMLAIHPVADSPDLTGRGLEILPGSLQFLAGWVVCNRSACTARPRLRLAATKVVLNPTCAVVLSHYPGTCAGDEGRGWLVAECVALVDIDKNRAWGTMCARNDLDGDAWQPQDFDVGCK